MRYAPGEWWAKKLEELAATPSERLIEKRKFVVKALNRTKDDETFKGCLDWLDAIDVELDRRRGP